MRPYLKFIAERLVDVGLAIVVMVLLVALFFQIAPSNMRRWALAPTAAPPQAATVDTSTAKAKSARCETKHTSVPQPKSISAALLPTHLSPEAAQAVSLPEGEREFVEYALGLYSHLQACAAPKIRTTRALEYWLEMEVDDVGNAVVTFKEDRNEMWMYHEWESEETLAKDAKFMDMWGGAPVADDELDVLRDCAKQYVSGHQTFRAHPIWWGQNWQRAMATRFPVTRAEIYDYASN